MKGESGREMVLVDGGVVLSAAATCTFVAALAWERGGEPRCRWVWLGLASVCVCDGLLLLLSVIRFGGLESFFASRANSLAILSRHSRETTLLCFDDLSMSVGLCCGSETTPSSFRSSWWQVSSLKLLGDTNMLLGAGGFSTVTPWEECKWLWRRRTMSSQAPVLPTCKEERSHVIITRNCTNCQ